MHINEFFIILFIFCVHVHVWVSLAVTCNKCVIDCGFGQYRTQYTPSRLRRSGVYRTVLPSPQSITHKYHQRKHAPRCLIAAKGPVTLRQICERFPLQRQREIFLAGHTAMYWSSAASRRKVVLIVTSV